MSSSKSYPDMTLKAYAWIQTQFSRIHDKELLNMGVTTAVLSIMITAVIFNGVINALLMYWVVDGITVLS